MSRRRTANALVSKGGIRFDEWMETLRAQNEGAVPKDHVNRIAKDVLRKCDPRQYLLSHATIVASVDTYAPKGVKTGSAMNRGVQIDVRFPDYRINPDCQEIVNNNGDAWERSLLLSTYRSFIGAHNYLEHVQLPELSKGFIVDAIARDLGKTCYVDILVATDRKHGQLASDILSGEITGLSMGCISLFTICTKCGNVASDDSQTCPCVEYEGKHTDYFDDQGQKHKISELIGHVSIPNSNQFIEASWVRNPAFRGAVRRNFLNADSPHVAAAMASSLSVNASRVPEISGVKKAASLKLAQGQQGQDKPDQSDSDDDADPLADVDLDQGSDQGGSDQGAQDQSGDKGADATPSDKIDSFLDKAQEQILTLLVDKLGDRLKPKPEDVQAVAPAQLMGANDNMLHAAEFRRGLRAKFSSPNVVRWATRAWNIVHIGGVPAIRKAGMTPRDLIVLSWIEDRVNGRMHPPALYKLAMQVGPMKEFPSKRSYLTACAVKSGRQLTAADNAFLLWKGRIANIV